MLLYTSYRTEVIISISGHDLFPTLQSFYPHYKIHIWCEVNMTLLGTQVYQIRGEANQFFMRYM